MSLSSWLTMPVVLLSAHTRPTQQQALSTTICADSHQALHPQFRAAAYLSPAGAAFVGGPGVFSRRRGHDFFSNDQVEQRFHVSKVSPINRLWMPWSGSGGGGGGGSSGSVSSSRIRSSSSSSSSSSSRSGHGQRRWRSVQAATMDCDGLSEVPGGDGKNRLVVREQEVQWQQQREAPNTSKTSATAVGEATVDFPNVQAPLDLPQPGEWMQVPPLGGDGPINPLPLMNGQVPSPGLNINSQNNNKHNDNSSSRRSKGKVDPFTVPDNDYTDSFVDSLWINLLSSRMAVAVEAEEALRTGAGARAGGRGEGNAAAASSASADDDRGGRGTNGGGSNGASTATSGSSSSSAAAAAAAASTAARRPGGGMGGGYSYEDYVALATRLQAGAPERQREVVRGVLRSVFPGWFPAFYRMLFPPSKFSAEVNAFMCPPLFGWLVGKSELTEGVVDVEAKERGEGRVPSQEVWKNTVKVERCRYLEASKCKGTCMNLCKLPTEAFFREDLGMPLRMTPNFEDLSCEFAFGQDALSAEEDPLMQEPCWTECLSSGKQPKKPQRACHTMPETPLRGP